MKTFGALVALLLLAGCAGATPEASETSPQTEVTQPDPNQAEVNAAPEEGAAGEAEPEASEPESAETEPTETEPTETATAEPAAPAVSPRPAATPTTTATPRPTAQATQAPSPTATPTTTATPRPTAQATQAPSPTATPEPTVTAGPVFVSKAEVAKNNTRASCWVIIDGSVYDLTRWISQHPGGAGNILNLCGRDGTSSFAGMHGGEARPSSVLQGYFLAELER